MANVETGYIKPVASTEKFVVSTSRVEEWLQRQINATAAVAKQNGHDVPPVNLTLFTLRASEKFHPFVIILPEEAMVRRGKNDDEEEMEMFNPESSQNTRKFLPHVWKVVSAYMYNRNDKKAFRSNEFRRTLRLTGDTSQYLSTIIYPNTSEKNGMRFTVMLIDPRRVFYAMAREGTGWKTDFQIEIEKTERNQGTDFSYTFNKVPKDSKKRKGKDVVNDIQKMMLTAARRGTK